MDPRSTRRARQRRARRRRRLAASALLATALGAALVGFAEARPSARRPVVHVVAKRPAPHDPTPVPTPAPVRPPQFLVVSFDGSGGTQLWPYWRSVARRAGAHFTFFASAVYLLDQAHRDEYHPPRHSAGASDIGFAATAADVSGMRRQMALAAAEGNEIGTHWGGHFCAPYPGSVGEWTAADWTQELGQVERITRVPFAGERTPCLQGNRAALFPVLAAHGFRYDASDQVQLGGWPYRERGLWELPLLEVPFVGHTYRVLSMDYNLFVNQATTPAAEIEPQAYETLWDAFVTEYRGARAPLSFANHFETWNGGAYDRALARVVLHACRLPEVRCVSFRELVDWLDAQPAPRLHRYEAGRFPVYRG